MPIKGTNCRERKILVSLAKPYLGNSRFIPGGRITLVWLCWGNCCLVEIASEFMTNGCSRCPITKYFKKNSLFSGNDLTGVKNPSTFTPDEWVNGFWWIHFPLEMENTARGVAGRFQQFMRQAANLRWDRLRTCNFRSAKAVNRGNSEL